MSALAAVKDTKDSSDSTVASTLVATKDDIASTGSAATSSSSSASSKDTASSTTPTPSGSHVSAASLNDVATTLPSTADYSISACSNTSTPAATATATAAADLAPIVVAEKTVTTTVASGVDAVVDEFEQLAFGKKNVKEIEEIQNRKNSHLSAGIMFDDPSLNIPAPILESLTREMRFTKPSAIQAATLPHIFQGSNVIAQAQSGAGKTIAFVIGMLSRVDSSSTALQALCLAPTRELANQIVSDAVLPLSTRMQSLAVECAVPRETPWTGKSKAQVCHTVYHSVLQ